MKHTKTLFFLFIFVLSFFQQQQEVNAQNLPGVDNLSSNQSPQAGGTIPLAEKLSQINAATANANSI